MLHSGRTLKKLFDIICPFEKSGKLKPEPERKTILASNANIPLEVQLKAFAMASAAEGGSPHIVQISYNSAMITGNHAKNISMVKGLKRSGKTRPTAVGSARARRMLEEYTEDFEAPLVFISLDHFTAPKFDAKACASPQGNGGLDRVIARARIDEAISTMKPRYGGEVGIDGKTRETYLNYLCGTAFGEYRKDFLAAVAASCPAWAMVDTGGLPPVLNFASTKDINQAVRNDLDNSDVMLEAEFSATGSSGKEEEYEKLTEDELESFKGKVVLFAKFAGAEGIAYEIGMVHAAKQGEKHEPDVERLEAVQRALLAETGTYIPFAQHGGTGAAKLERGLVGKNNINTQYMVDGANFFADHYEKDKEGLRSGGKKQCGTDIYTKMALPEAQRAIEKLRETGTFGKAGELLARLGIRAEESEAAAEAVYTPEAAE